MLLNDADKPPSKKIKVSQLSLSKVTDAELRKLVTQALDGEDGAAVASALQTRIEKLLKMKQSKPVDLKYFGSAANSAIHQMDRLRPSQQFDQSHRVSDDLVALLAEAEQLGKPEHVIQALARIAGVFSHATDTGEVFKCISSCGGFQSSLAGAQLEELESDDMEWGELRDAYEQLQRMDARLQDYGIEEFDEVLTAMKEKLGGDDSDELAFATITGIHRVFVENITK
eukprot:gene15164-21235_t